MRMDEIFAWQFVAFRYAAYSSSWKQGEVLSSHTFMFSVILLKMKIYINMYAI